MERGTHRTTKVVLPSGKTIEVISFEGEEDGRAPRGLDLHTCTSCGSHLVHPLDWSAAGTDCWEIELRCPECEHRTSGTYHDSDVQRFDTELDAATDAIAADLRRMMRADMEDVVQRFIAALHADAILPEDF